MKRIDAHQHFWLYHPVKDAWITDDMAVIQRNFMPEDLKPILDINDVSGCVAVQADQSEAETLFLLELAAKYPFIMGVVGWMDLQADDLSERLEYFREFDKLKGFRHIVQSEEDPRFLLRPAFLKGVETLGKYGYTYDILVKPHQLDATLEFVRHFPDQAFVIDHLAKPYIKSGEHLPWATQMEAIAQHKNVCCKLSGMVTEADLNDWESADFNYYIQHILEVFGVDRVMFGSDWPVCLLATDYGNVVELLSHAIAHLPPGDQELIWHKNATNFYKL